MPVKKPASPEKKSNLFRRLSSILLIDSSVFAKATPTVQTSTLAGAGDLPVLFVSSFADLSNKKRLRDSLLSGKDVSTELEFNEIILTEEEKATLKAVLPILEKIGTIGPSYDWADAYDGKGINCQSDRIFRSGHSIAKAPALALWKKASNYWSGGKKPTNIRTRADGCSWNNRDVTYGPDQLSIGCQNIPRAEVEYIARHYGWEPVVFEG